MNLRQAIAVGLGIFCATAAHPQGFAWTGPTMTFSNAPGADWTQPANQDHLASDVWLTRLGTGNNLRGLFNAARENHYVSSLSPVGTEWALGSLANYATLTYADWATCFGGPGNLNSTIISTNAVLHLVNEDIYLSVRFTFFGSSGTGGFAYERSTPANVPEPSAKIIFAMGTPLLFFAAGKLLHRKMGF